MWLPDFRAPAPSEDAALIHCASLARSSHPRLLCVVVVDEQDGPLPFSSSSGTAQSSCRGYSIVRSTCPKLDTTDLYSEWICILKSLGLCASSIHGNPFQRRRRLCSYLPYYTPVRTLPHQRADSLIDDSRVTLLIYLRILFSSSIKLKPTRSRRGVLEATSKTRPNNSHPHLDS